jgi:hypothetical protein
MRMDIQGRCAEILSSDGLRRLAIYNRGDLRYVLVEERVRSYEAGDEWNPAAVPFPTDGNWKSFWVIEVDPLNGLYGTVEDAVKAARLLLANER